MSEAGATSLVLHHGWRSSASRRVRLALAEKGLSFESRIVDMVNGEQHSPEYLAINPNGVVPTLVHDGRAVFESSVICEYLDEAFPALPPLRPADAYARSVMRNFVRWVDEHCLPRIIVFNWSVSMQPVASGWNEQQLAERLARIPSAERREAWTRVARKPYTDDEKADAMRGLLVLLDRIDEQLAVSRMPWLTAPWPTIADFAAAPFVMRISELQPGAIESHTAASDWWQRLRARPCFGRARIEPYDASVHAERAAAPAPQRWPR